MRDRQSTNTESTNDAPRRSGIRGLLTCAVLLLALIATPSVAEAKTTRLYESSFGSFSGSPKAIAVDQANGDVYVAVGSAVHRFTAGGAPKNFTAGPNAGTNMLAGFPPGQGISIAVDNSGGPLDGTIYVTESGGPDPKIRAFAGSGASLGAITEAGADPSQQEAEEGVPATLLYSPSGVAVDQSNGDIYVVEAFGFNGDPGHVWRYRPSAPGGAVDDADYILSGITVPNAFAVAVDSGQVYVTKEASNGKDALYEYSASDFSSAFGTQPVPRTVGAGAGASGITAVAVDPANGEVYANEGNRIAVFDAAGTALYTFGFAAYLGAASEGIGVRSAGSGPASKAYVSVPVGGSSQVDAFGPLALAASPTHTEVAGFGSDGTGGSSFAGDAPNGLAFDQAARALYVAQAASPSGVFGFDAAAPPAFPSLTGFAPLAATPGQRSGIAVDNTALSSAGNLYLASSQTDLLYGWNAAGTSLAGFPVDPALSPGAPSGSPKDLCGAAVDSTGDIWVSNTSTKRIIEYSPAGVFTGSTIDTSAQGTACQIAFDGDDNLYSLYSQAGLGLRKYTAASGYATAVKIARGAPGAVAVDPSSDHVFVAYSSNGACSGGACSLSWIDEYDEVGNLVDEFAMRQGGSYGDLALDATNRYAYVADVQGFAAGKVRVIGPGLLLPEVASRHASAIGNTQAVLNGTVINQGILLEDCHFEYVSEAAFHVSGFDDLSSGGDLPCAPAAGDMPLDLEEHPVSAIATGLATNTTYRFRLLASNENGTDETTDLRFATAGRPLVQTTGTPVRSATTAQLQGRVFTLGVPTAYHFEYGAAGPCDANPCQSTEPQAAGAGEAMVLAAEHVEGLTPATTYHYRVVAENGNPDGAAYGADMTVTTRATDARLSHGHFPGPVGSDRAWEQVNLPDTGGNPVGETPGFASSGNRALYGIFGGTPSAESGSFLSLYFAERPPGDHPISGWQTRLITPPREELVGAGWFVTDASTDLSAYVGINGEALGRRALFRLSPEKQATKLFDPVAPQEFDLGNYAGVSGDGQTVLVALKGGTLDPAFPAAAAVFNLYEIDGGTPELVSFLPGESLAACGLSTGASPFPAQQTHWLSADGSRVIFPSLGAGPCGKGKGVAQLYLRDLDAEESKLISGPPLSGPACEAELVKATATAAFLTTASRLDPADEPSVDCAGGNDVYRYDFGAETLECLTCLVAGLETEVLLNAGSASNAISVSDDGSRLYFASKTRLAPGAPEGSAGLYRLAVNSGELAFVAPVSAGVGFTASDVSISTSGEFFAFRSGLVDLNVMGAEQNGGTAQLYLYDDRSGALNCASCPADGTPAKSAVPSAAVPLPGPNIDPLADDGTLAFATPNSLVGVDQNTSAAAARGTDVYEWRDGRILLVTDGLSQWPSKTPPGVRGITPSGRDLFFSAPARYTPDAPDSYIRLYDARIGGGIEFPEQPQPCPLEVCQGIPKGAPEEAAPGTAAFAGPGNLKPPAAARSCPKGKRRVRRAGKARCVKKQAANHRRHKRANHSRRVER